MVDTVWRFLRTVAWAAVGAVLVFQVIIPIVQALTDEKGPDWLSARQSLVLGGLMVVTAGVLALVTAGIQRLTNKTTPLTTAQRAILQFLQTVAAGAVSPVLADTLLDTTVNYGRAWVSLLGAAVVAGLQAYGVNKREADRDVATPLPADAEYQRAA